MLKSAIKSYCFVPPDFMSRPFCSHVAMLQDGASSGAYFVACRFQNECNKVEIGLRVVQFWSEIKLVITAFDFRPNCTLLSAITIIYHTLLNKTPAQAFTPPANEKKMGTIWIFGYYG